MINLHSSSILRYNTPTSFHPLIQPPPQIGRDENFSDYFFPFSSRSRPVGSHSSVVKLIKENFSILFFLILHAHHNSSSFIQMFCAENCFIDDEWKATPKWLMKNIMRQSDTNFLFFFFSHRRAKKAEKREIFRSIFSYASWWDIFKNHLD